MSGKLKHAGLRFGIVVSRFNHFISAQLLEGSLRELKKQEIQDPLVVWVPGAFELPLMCKALAERKDIDVVVALGCVIRGDTPHFEYVCQAATAGITQTMLEVMKPISFGVLTTETLEQAIQRAAISKDNKGGEVTAGAVEMALRLRDYRIPQ